MEKITPQQAKEKIGRYCAYQERCHSEVRDKLYEYGLRTTEVDELLSDLILQGYLNEERFARTFAGSKFRLKKWGRIKIVHELKARDVSKNCIASGLKEIDETEYLSTLRKTLEKKIASLSDENRFSMRDKAARYAIQKGFEPELTWVLVKELLPD